jgi:hypothetical protein
VLQNRVNELELQLRELSERRAVAETVYRLLRFRVPRWRSESMPLSLVGYEAPTHSHRSSAIPVSDLPSVQDADFPRCALQLHRGIIRKPEQ